MQTFLAGRSLKGGNFFRLNACHYFLFQVEMAGRVIVGLRCNRLAEGAFPFLNGSAEFLSDIPLAVFFDLVSNFCGTHFFDETSQHCASFFALQDALK